jgi:N-acetylglucosamine-6-phosphate deacetylase
VLTAVTSAPAALVGRGDIGRLRPGARADLVVLDDDLQVRETWLAGEPTDVGPTDAGPAAAEAG